MKQPANLITRSFTQRITARLLASLLIASMLVAASWPAVVAQDATPDDAAQPEVIVTDEPAVTDVPDVPAAPEVIENQDEPEPPPPTPTPMPTVVPANGDYLQAVTSPDSNAMAPGATIEFDFAYQVTTPRGSTTIVAELDGGSGQNGAWTVQLEAGGVWSDTGSRVQVTDAQSTGGGSAMPLSVIVTAPQNVVVDETITIWLSSSVARYDGGVEQGIVATQPVASARVVPPPPTPTPTAVPIVDPTLACAGPAEYSVQVGGTLELTCEVTVLDNRAGASLAVEAPSGWTVSSGDGQPSDTLALGPFALDSGASTAHTVPIAVQAPKAVGATGDLTIRLLQDSESLTELDAKTIQLTSIVPADWTLSCSTGSAASKPGTSVDISCAVPDAAWAVRGDQPAYSVSSARGWVNGGSGDIDGAAFSFSLDIPCTVAVDADRLAVSADLGNGLKFATLVSLSIDQSAATLVPVLTHPGIEFGNAQWLGSSYAPAEATVTLTVSGASSACAAADWAVQLNTSSFSNGDVEIDPAITFSTLDSTGKTISPKPDGTVAPGAGAIVVSGTGDGVVVVHLTLSIPATVGAGTFSGDVDFSLSTGP